MPALSGCMIVRNESQNLPALLDQLNRVCDQVVVVDTGSTDDTAAVAESRGAEVTAFPWSHSFSEARNVSLSLARHPWILCVDADDRLPDACLRGLRRLVLEPPESAFTFVVRSTQDGRLGMASEQIRLFPQDPAIRFTYRVHEQIRPALVRRRLPIYGTALEILHRGYPNRDVVARKQRRNLRLLEKDIEDHPRDGFLHFTAGMAHRDLGRLDRAADSWRTAWSLASPRREQAHLALGAALELCGLSLDDRRPDLNEALLWLERAESVNPDHPQCLYLRGLWEHTAKDLEAAALSLERLMEASDPGFRLPMDLTTLKAQGAALLGKIYLELRRNTDAVRVLEQARRLIRKE